MQRTIPRGWLQWLLPAASRGSRAVGLPAMLGVPWQPDEPRSSTGRQLQLHWLSSGSTGWGPRARCQRWVQARRCKVLVNENTVIVCTTPNMGGKAAHSSGPACRSLERAVLTRLRLPVKQTMRPGHGRRARRLRPAGRRWNLHSWQVGCCQTGCHGTSWGPRFAGQGGSTQIHQLEALPSWQVSGGHACCIAAARGFCLIRNA